MAKLLTKEQLERKMRSTPTSRKKAKVLAELRRLALDGVGIGLRASNTATLLPAGLYAGRPIETVPTGYLRRFLDRMWYKDSTLYKDIEAELKRRASIE